ncbi:MAG: LamG-like jellyroll fold domain-containing protein, partial [Nanoarchaeota archaeon]
TGNNRICDFNEWFNSTDTSKAGIRSLEVFNGKLYSGSLGGTGSSGSAGEVFVCYSNNSGNVSACDNNLDWASSFNNTLNSINVLRSFNGRLYAGAGDNGSNGDVWMCRPNITGDDKVCDTGDWIKSYDTSQINIFNILPHNGILYATGDDIFFCNPKANSTNLGEGLKECDQDEWAVSLDGGSYNGSGLTSIDALEVFNGRLYASVSRGDIIRCDPYFNSSGDDTICEYGDWNTTFSAIKSTPIIYSLKSFNGRLFAGGGSSTSGDSRFFACNPAKNISGSDIQGGDNLVCEKDDWQNITNNPGITRIYTLETFNNYLYLGVEAERTSNKDDIYFWGNAEQVNSSTTSWDPQTWYHVAATYNGTTMLIYVNGVLENTRHINITMDLNLTSLLIGNGDYGALNGSLDDVAVWNRSLTQAEISSLINLSLIRHYWRANATDTNSFTNNSAKFEFTITNTTIVMNTVYPANATNLSSSFTNLTYNVSVVNSVPSNCTLFIDNAINQTDTSITENTNQTFNVTFADGSYRWIVGCISQTEIKENTTSRTFTIDTKLPNLTANSPSNTTNQTSTQVTFNVYAEDLTLKNVTLYGNWSGSLAFNATNSSANLSGNNVTFTINISQSDTLTAGYYIWSAVACDELDRCNRSDNRTFTIDTKLPNLTVNTPINTTNQTSTQVTFNVTPQDVNVKNVTLYGNWSGTFEFNATNTSLNSGNDVIFTINISQSDTLTDGVYLWSTIACDSAGNCNRSSNRTFTIDTKLPNFTANSPSNTTNQTSTQVTFNVFSQDVNIENVTLYGNWSGSLAFNATNSSANLSGNNVTFTINISQSDTLTAGYYIWSAVACDELDRCNRSDNRTFTIDTKLPNLTVNTPINTTNQTSTQVTFNVTPQDVNVKNVTLYGNWSGTFEFNATNTSLNSGNDVIFTINISQSDGVYLWSTIACDSAGNCNRSSNRTFTIDTEIPNLTVNAPANLTNQSSTLVVFNVTPADNLGNILNVTLYGNWSGSLAFNATNSSQSLSGNAVIFSINISQADGAYLWSTIACDSAGNCNRSSNQTVTVDPTSPSISGETRNPHTIYSNVSAVLNATITDAT